MPATAPTAYLLLGCEGVGKTLFVRRLKQMCQSKTSQAAHANIYDTMPTVGVELDELQYAKTKFVVREIGGSFMAVWDRYFNECDHLLYMVDTSNLAQISLATTEFYHTLSAAEMKNKPTTLIFNKTDAACTVSESDLQSLMRLDDLGLSLGSMLNVLFISASSMDGMQECLDHIVSHAEAQRKNG